MGTLHRLLAFGQILLVASTWRLWTPQTKFPQIPMIRSACAAPIWLDWLCLISLVGACLGMLVCCHRRRLSKYLSSLLAVSLAGFFILDQHRLQPWAWQFFLLAVLLSVGDEVSARRGWQWLVIGIYFWSAVSKLDYTFCHVQGPALLKGLRLAIGLRGISNAETVALDVIASFGTVLGELTIAFLLAWSRHRRHGLWMATTMHLLLLAALGPLGLNHTAGVLSWNIFFLIQNWLIFFEHDLSELPATDLTSPRLPKQDDQSLPLSVPLSSRIALALALAWPALQPMGYCDHWMAWSVYSGRAESGVLIISPKSTRNELPTMDIGEGRLDKTTVIDIGQWSLRTLAVPCNPQSRLYVGVALAVAESDSIARPEIRIQLSPNRWTGEERVLVIGKNAGRIEVEETAKLAETFRINAFPRQLPKHIGDH